LNRSKLIKADLVYDTKIGAVIKEIEEVYGYDDYTNFVFYLLHEMSNKYSQWKPYLDLLPRQPTSLAFKYAEKKNWVEAELLHTPILSTINLIIYFNFNFLEKFIDYKFLIEKKAKNYYHGIVANNTEQFDQDYFNEENIKWACMILDSRLMYIDYEAFLIPMLDFANYAENEQDKNKIFRAKFNEDYTKSEVKAMKNFIRDHDVYESLGYNNDNYLIYHGIALKENFHDCYSISLTFSERQDDNLREKRITYFSKYFLYDKNDIDQM